MVDDGIAVGLILGATEKSGCAGWEPVEITIEPDRISILNFSGPNHTIPMEAIREGKSLRSRRYRNRRLGEFLKELDLTEGRATGIPTVQEELEANGSPRATIETDEERTYFLIDIPCHPYFTKKEIEIDTNGVKEDAESGVKDGVKDGVKSGVKSGVKELSDIQEVIVKEMLFDPSVTTSEMAQKTGIKFRTLNGGCCPQRWSKRWLLGSCKKQIVF